MIERLLQHEASLLQDMQTLGANLQPRQLELDQTPSVIWHGVRAICRAPEALVPPYKSPVMHTEFGARVVDLLQRTPYGNCIDNKNTSRLAACIEAEPYFLGAITGYALLPERVRKVLEQAHPAFIEFEGEVVGVLKPYYEPSILGLREAPGIYPGALSALPCRNDADKLKELIAEAPDTSLLRLDNLIEHTGKPLLIRPSTFMLNEAVRNDFGDGLNKHLPGVAEMRQAADAKVKDRRRNARLVGEQVLEQFLNQLASTQDLSA